MSKRLPIEVQNHDKQQGFFYNSMGEVSDGYYPYVGTPDTQTCQCCGTVLHRVRPKAQSLDGGQP